MGDDIAEPHNGDNFVQHQNETDKHDRGTIINNILEMFLRAGLWDAEFKPASMPQGPPWTGQDMSSTEEDRRPSRFSFLRFRPTKDRLEPGFQ